MCTGKLATLVWSKFEGLWIITWGSEATIFLSKLGLGVPFFIINTFMTVEVGR